MAFVYFLNSRYFGQGPRKRKGDWEYRGGGAAGGGAGGTGGAIPRPPKANPPDIEYGHPIMTVISPSASTPDTNPDIGQPASGYGPH